MVRRSDIPTVKQDIVIRQGSLSPVRFEFLNASGLPADMSGFTLEGQIRQGFTETNPALTFIPDNDGASTGVFLLYAEEADIANMPTGDYTGDQARDDAAYGPWDAELTDGTFRYRVGEGKVTLSREATQ